MARKLQRLQRGFSLSESLQQDSGRFEDIDLAARPAAPAEGTRHEDALAGLQKDLELARAELRHLEQENSRLGDQARTRITASARSRLVCSTTHTATHAAPDRRF